MQPIFTERLVLRSWRKEDIEPFAAMNQDCRVMECFPNILSIDETVAFIEKINAHFAQHGFGLYACTLRDSHEFIGFVGLNIPTFEAHFTPCVEIGWRLAFDHWGKGYATEAAQKVLKIGFEDYKLKEIVSFTTQQNARSRRVMEKLGMTHHEIDDFYHPNLLLDHSLSRHVLYRLKS